MIERLRCLIRGTCDAVRYPLGGFRCRLCGHVGADMGDMGYLDSAYVNPLRRTFDRVTSSVTRSYGW